MYGSKIENLIKLRDAGFAVPDFEFIKFADAIDDIGAFSSYYLDVSKKSPNEASAKIREYLKEHLRKQYDIGLHSTSYAVRSSSNMEDGADDSFAGQFETYLNVSSSDLDVKIRNCFLSLANENVIEYLRKKKIDTDHIEMNVLVQKMIVPDCAGVLFTANPQGLLNEIVVVVGEGLGENVVAEKKETTSYYYNQTDGNYFYDGAKNYLSRELLLELIEKSRKITDIFGKYVDIEFAIKNKKIYFLQVRPITTLDDSHPLVLDNSNIVESYPGISLPLTISFANLIYSGVFESECRRLVKDETELKRQKHVFTEMVGSCNGRMYYKISNWYALIDYLPFRKKIIPMWEEMLGINTSVKIEQHAGALMHARVAKNFLHEIRKSQKNMAWLNDYFIQVEKSYRARFSKDLNAKETMALFHEVAGKLFPHWDLTLINDMYTFINVGAFKKRLGDRANGYISSVSNLESMKPVETMIQLAYEKDTLSQEEYDTRFAEYIEKYGDRNVEELKLESDTFRTNPELLRERIDDYRKDPDNLAKLVKSIKQKNNSHPQKLSGLNGRLLKHCESGIRNREISRLNRSRIFGMVREMLLHIGSIMVKEKHLDDVKDIFYLRIKEIEEYVKKPSNLRDIVAERKMHYNVFSQLPAASRLVFAEHEFDKLPLTINAEVQKYANNDMHGTPCSDGCVTGEALIIDSAGKHYNTNGKILITKSTDPGWVFMLSTAKGIISERGSLLSHTAIISRELKIPSVVGVKDVTKIIKNGDIVFMDGHTGEIKIKETK